MSTGNIYGELYQTSACGTSQSAAPAYISHNVFAYVSGNQINFVNSNSYSPHGTPLVANNQITAFAAFQSENVIAYAEKLSTTIRLVRWPDFTPIGANNGRIQAPKDLEISCLTFSADGQFLASLGSLPNHSLCVWDWKCSVITFKPNEAVQSSEDSLSQTPLLCQTSNLGPATTLTFNPLDKRMLCTSNPGSASTSDGRIADEFPDDELDLDVMIGQGDALCRGLRLWKIKMGYRNWELKQMEFEKAERSAGTRSQLPPSQSESVKNGETPPHLKHRVKKSAIALGHVWRSDQSVVVTTTEDYLLLYSPLKETCRILRVEPIIEKVEKKSPKSASDTNQSIDHQASSIIPDTDLAKATQTIKKDFMTSVRTVIYAKDLLIAAGENGVLNYIKTDKPSAYLTKKVQLSPKSPMKVISLIMSWDYSTVLAEMEDGRIISVSTKTDYSTTVALTNEPKLITCMDNSALSNAFITGTNKGSVLLWESSNATSSTLSAGQKPNPTNLSVKKRIDIPGACISSLSCSQYSSQLISVGSSSGFVRIFNLKHGKEALVATPPTEKLQASTTSTLLFSERLFSSSVLKLEFDPTGNYLACCSEDTAYIIDVAEDFKVIGYVEYFLDFQTMSFHIEEPEEQGKEQMLYLYILTGDSANECSYIHRFTLPATKEDFQVVQGGYALTKESTPSVIYRTEYFLVDLQLAPTRLASGKETFYALSKDRKLVEISSPQILAPVPVPGLFSSTGEKIEAVSLPKPFIELPQHDKPGCRIKLGNSVDWIYTFSKDGVLCIRSLAEFDKELRIQAHDPFQGGIKDVILVNGGRNIISLGHDHILKSWDWIYTALGIRAVTDVMEEFESTTALRAEAMKKVATKIYSLEGLELTPDSPTEPVFGVKKVEKEVVEDQVDLAKDQYVAEMSSKIEELKEKISALVVKNETLPTLEKIDKEEFVLDLKERDRLLDEADEKIKSVRRSIEDANMKKRIIRERIKAECWDSMEVIGTSVKSFGEDPHTGKIIEVKNYSMRKLSDEEVEKAQRVIVHRKVQLDVAKEAASRDKFSNRDNDYGDDENQTDNKQSLEKGVQGLLYDPFDLITGERRRTQAILLNESIFELKNEFNQKHTNFVKLKREGIQKIDEKNERIATIMEELQIEEDIFRPSLDDDESPERVIEVLDSEVTVEKFITPEERRKMEERRFQEEERLRAQQKDNWAERALNQMMGGKLEDRNDQEEKEELARPEWMNKPKEEMSDEEKKLVKEYEKKLAVYKEEQEKYKKALETELRKLQSSITEVCEQFDQTIADFFKQKLRTDQLIYQTELKLIKLNQCAVFSERDEITESEIVARLEMLKGERSICMAEIPEIKKDLERCREEYDQVLKKDKEIERQFRKEFHSYDFYYEALLKLFRRREQVSEADLANMEVRTVTNPFKKEGNERAVVWEEPPELNADLDMPEGLSMDLWNKLVEYRTRKINLERDAFLSHNRYQEMQILVQSVLDESERIRIETDNLSSDLNQFLEYKFHSTYNVECLFELKQGQVEIPQAPVVTDYSEAVLIHRGCVERLNESISALGKTKVDALREIKEYRKGIHALEWENKMLDFQAEDAVIRTRDIQLLRLTKQMQEYLRSGDEYAHATEILALEKRAEYSQKAHLHKLDEKKRGFMKLERKINEKINHNKSLDEQLESLEKSVMERNTIYESSKNNSNSNADSNTSQATLPDIYTRRRLVDLAKAQAQDIAILREEVERLRLRTYPAFSASKRTAF